jgi:HlyD family secretion protein
MRWRKYALLLVAAISGVTIIGWTYVAGTTPGGGSPIRFAAVERADLEVSTIATGRINAIDAVGVSSQLSGQVVELHANFNDKVAPGAPLARLDDKTFKAAVAEAEARLAHGKASYDSAVATTAGANARYEAARQDFERKNSLREKGSISVQEVDRARANLLTAESEMSAGRADEAVQKAAIDMAEAALRRAEIDLERTIIRSPIDGIVIRRSVELGQTVAVSMEAPTLFTIAHDLRDMRVHARVDEADIGQIKVGQNARFSVDAHPDRNFAGKVVEIHRAPETVQNVVTYTVLITAENPDLALLPGMTAVVRIATTERPHALLVPNAALRFEPETAAAEAPIRDGPASELAGRPALVWLRTDSGGLSPVDIRVGASNGSVTEVVSGPLSEGQAVAIGKGALRSQRTLFGIRLGF